MVPLRDVVSSLYGAYRLAHFDAKGMDFLDRTALGALRSFSAAVILAPAYLVLMLFRLGDDAANASLSNFLVVESIAYVISWAAYPLIMDDLSRMLDCSDRYPAFISAYNWTSVLQMLIYLPAIAISESGVFVPAMGEALVFAATIAVLAYQWFVTQTALGVSSFTAAGLVIFDMALSMFISGAADSML